MSAKHDALYDLLFSTVDYEGGAQRVHEIVQARKPGAASLLDVGCGPGRHLSYLQRWYEVAGLDLSEVMLEQARARLPDVPLHHADMRKFDLGRSFDAVICLSSAIANMTTVPDLQKTIANMARHLNPGGVLIVEPWDDPQLSPPTSEPYLTSYEELGRRVVMLEITMLKGDIWVQDSHYLDATPEYIEHFHERVEVGAFTHADNIGAFAAAGLAVEHDPIGLLDRGLYIGVRPW